MKWILNFPIKEYNFIIKINVFLNQNIVCEASL